MGNRDLHFLMRVIDGNTWGQKAIPTAKGEHEAGRRLERAGFLKRDRTVKHRPYAYIPTDKGWAAANAMLGVLSAIADLECKEVS